MTKLAVDRGLLERLLEQCDKAIPELDYLHAHRPGYRGQLISPHPISYQLEPDLDELRALLSAPGAEEPPETNREKCPACAGTGYSPNSDVWIPHPCGECHGGGKVKTKETPAPPET